jgi:hypothetical protein
VQPRTTASQPSSWPSLRITAWKAASEASVKRPLTSSSKMIRLSCSISAGRRPVLQAQRAELLRVDRAFHRVARAQDANPAKALRLRHPRHDLSNVQPGQRRLRGHVRERDVNRVVGADQELGPRGLELPGRRQHQRGHSLPVVPVDCLHVLGEAVGVQAHLGVGVGAQALAPVERHRPVAERSPLAAAGHDPYVRRHGVPPRVSYDTQRGRIP